MASRTLFILGILLMLVIAGASTFFTRNLPAQITYFYSNDPNYPNQDAYTRCSNARTAGQECCYEGSAYMLMNKCTIAGAAVDTSALGNYYPSAPNGQPGDSCGFLDSYPCCPGSSMMPIQDPGNSWAFKYCYGQGSGYGSRYYCVKGSQEIMPYYGGSNSSSAALAGQNGICKYECEASVAGVPGTPPQCKWKDGTAITSMPASPGINERCAMQQTPCCPGPSTTSPILSGGGTTPNDIMCQNNYYCDSVTGRCKDPYGVCGNGEVEGSEMCDLGTGNFQGDAWMTQQPQVPPTNLTANCTNMCTLRCNNGTCDAYECSTNTDPNSLYCAGDCAAAGQCGDGCDNDTDQFRNAKDPGCYTWDPVYVKGGGKDPHPTPLITGGNETLDCPQAVTIPFEGPVGHEGSRANGSNMCKPVFDYGLCAPPGGPGTQSSEPYSGNSDVVLWPSIETCCREQANWVVTYLCDNSHDPAKTKEMMGNRKANPLCGDDVKEAMREEFVAICACENGGQTTMGSPKVLAIETLRDCAEQQCPEACRNGGANWKECGACMGAGGMEGYDNTKANGCRAQAIMACGGQTSSTIPPTSSSVFSTSSSSKSSSSSSSSSIKCGNGVVEVGEDCDEGTANVPSDVANLPMNVIYLIRKNGSAQHNNKTYNNTHLALLKTSSCLDTCKTAQCGDISDNEPDTKNNQNDVGCHLPVVQTTVGAPYDCTTLTTDYLPGRNSELDLCQENPSSLSSSTSSSSSTSRSAVHESSTSANPFGLPSSSRSSSSTSRSSSVSSSSQRSSVSSSAPAVVPSSTSRSSTTSTSRSSVATVGSSSSRPSYSRSSSSNTSAIVDGSSSSRSTSRSSTSTTTASSLRPAAPGSAASSALSITRLVLNQALPACGGNECGLGGSQFCALSNQTCVQTNDLPCIRCVGGSSSSQSRSSEWTCSGQECVLGGSDFCGLSGQTCVSDMSNAQCFRCTGPSSVSSVTVASSSSARPIIELADLPAFCGNGITEDGEQCDDGENNSNEPNACRANCTLSRCGDGIIDIPLEACDDGNMRSNDGCSQTCQLERTPTETLPAQIIELPFTQPVAQSSQPLMNPAEKPATNNQQPTTDMIQHAAPPANPDTGPAALAVMISGAAAGYAFMKRKKSL